MKPFFKYTLGLAAVVAAAASCAKGDYVYGPEFNGMADYESSAAYYDGGMEQPGNPGSGDRFDKIVENDFVKAADQPVSTFSVDADGAAYAYARRCISVNGWLPDANSVRIEEYLNYFTFNYPDPVDDNDVALNAEIGTCPWNGEHLLLRLGIKGKSIRDADAPLANYVFLIDISGSMSSDDKLPILKSGLITMLDYMRPDDRVAIVTYASGEELVLESTPVSEKQKIVDAIKPLVARGSTSGASAMEMAYNEVLKNYNPQLNNRVIMGTDGDFNVGVTSTEALKEMVEGYADRGIYLTICGFGSGNLNDSMMEQISNSGNGTYHYIDSETEMTKVFVNERERFVSVANDCKSQVTFDPAFVDSYRLIGYENRVMSNEDFENDKKDAAEIGAGQTITALFEIIPVADVTAASFGTFDFRYKKTLGSGSIPLGIDLPAVSEQVSSEFMFAASLAAFGMSLRDSQYKGSSSVQMAYDLALSARTSKFDPYGYRSDYLSLLETAKTLVKE